jgi:hypothetical protein
MRNLARSRVIFHSEADFQHAVAWELHQRLPTAHVTLERPYRTGSAPLHLDLLIRSRDGRALAIELKYKTVKLAHSQADEGYALSDQRAQDIGRYDFIKDIWRLEEITQAIPRCHGWAILLTNDSSYWRPTERTDTVDAAFRLHGLSLQGTRGWGQKASAGTMKNREMPIPLRSAYNLKWADFSHPSILPNGIFRYLGIQVTSAGLSSDLSTEPAEKPSTVDQITRSPT